MLTAEDIEEEYRRYGEHGIQYPTDRAIQSLAIEIVILKEKLEKLEDKPCYCSCDKCL
jgi:hypothetical protein